MASKPRPPSYLIGTQFRRLTVLSLRHASKGSPGAWVYYARCQCVCGNQTEVLTASLIRGSTQSCGCYGREMASLKHTGSNSSSFRGHQGITSRYWHGVQRDAMRRGWAVSVPISYAWQIFEAQGATCALSGASLAFGPNAKRGITTASLDRLDPLVGYEIGNLQWTHKTINLMRHRLSIDDFVLLCAQVTNPEMLPELVRLIPSIPQRDERPSKYIGNSFGRLTIKAVFRPMLPYVTLHAEALCECGVTIIARLDSIVRGSTQSCGCLQFTGFREIRGAMWAGYIDSAKRREIPFHLSVEEAWGLYEAQGRLCAMSFEPIHFGSSGAGANTTASLDRIDNNSGYEIGNVQWVSKRINLMRRTLTIEEFKYWCKRVTEWQSSTEKATSLTQNAVSIATSY